MTATHSARALSRLLENRQRPAWESACAGEAARPAHDAVERFGWAAPARREAGSAEVRLPRAGAGARLAAFALMFICALFAVAPDSAYAQSSLQLELLGGGQILTGLEAPAAQGNFAANRPDAAPGLVSGIIAQAKERVEQARMDAEVERARLEGQRALEVTRAAELTDKLLPYDPALIARIGTQEQSGHTVCCPSFSCAYADAVMDGTVHDHSYYTCSSCTWTDWGGGASSYRRVGGDAELLREAYDQIRAGRPTVIHVRASYGEHWIALIGYENAADPDHLALSNFIALDPWDGAQVNAGASFTLYGDGCEHISER